MRENRMEAVLGWGNSVSKGERLEIPGEEVRNSWLTFSTLGHAAYVMGNTLGEEKKIRPQCGGLKHHAKHTGLNTMEHYSALKKNEILTTAQMGDP